MPFESNILVTGANGYVGSLLVARLLADTSAQLVLPVRAGHDPDSVRQRLLAECSVLGLHNAEMLGKRMAIVPLPPMERLGDLAHLAVDEIVHCAGSADYFDPVKLKAGNIDLTRAVVELGKRLHVKRLIMISTAFASGYRDNLIREELHAGPADDPNAYTTTKREAEWIVAKSGLAYLIVRPSIVVGDSRDGRYCGPRFGLYQLWYAAARFMCAEYLSRIHSIAPFYPMQLVHQDALQAGFMAAYRQLEPGAVIHLVSQEASLPTVRDMYNIWMEQCLRPHEVLYYDRFEDVPMDVVSPQERCFIEFADVNLRIAARRWRFETRALDRMQAAGLHYVDATLETMAVCQQRFMAESRWVQEFLKKHRKDRNLTDIHRRHIVAR
jgi:nucleoside-diphosphate-sugar epimerase